MIKKIRELRRSFTEFSASQYYGEFRFRAALSLGPLFFLAIDFYLLRQRTFAGGGASSIFLASLILSLIFYLLLAALYWKDYYQTVMTAVIKMEHIKKKYSLIDAKNMTSYAASLHIILDLVDSNLEREYSNQLLQKQIEFDAMKNQINPHFLYNTLDTIRGYAMIEDAPITSDMIEVLSRLFRYSLSQKNNIIPLCQELSMLADYIKIQQYRVNKQIDFIEDIDSTLDVMDFPIPKLTIQPFIENAIKHGMKDIAKDFLITLQIYRTQSRLVISVSDNGAGMTPEQLSALNMSLVQKRNTAPAELDSAAAGRGTGIALSNVNARIKLIYGTGYGVVAYSTLGNGSQFQITLPYPAQQLRKGEMSYETGNTKA